MGADSMYGGAEAVAGRCSEVNSGKVCMLFLHISQDTHLDGPL